MGNGMSSQDEAEELQPGGAVLCRTSQVPVRRSCFILALEP